MMALSFPSAYRDMSRRVLTHARAVRFCGTSCVCALMFWSSNACAQPIFTTAPSDLSRVVLNPQSNPQSSPPSGGLKPNETRSGEPQAQANSAPVSPTEAPRLEAGPTPTGPAPTQLEAAERTPALLPAQAPIQVRQRAPEQRAPEAASAIEPPPELTSPPITAFGADPTATPPAFLAAKAPLEQPVRKLRHLTNNIQGFRLSGEIASIEWPVYVTAGQTRQGAQFQLGYLTAVSVMPEASFLTLIVNDKPIGRINIRAASVARVLTFDVAAHILQPGFNSVRVTAEMRHRVDCSLGATYELWTQIDPTQTGFLLAREDKISSLADLAALSPDAQGALPMRAVTPERTSLANIERYIQVAQMISLVGRFAQPVVDYGPPADGDYGINLAIGAVSEIARIVDPGELAGVDGARILVTPARPGRRTTVIVTGQTDSQVNEALAHFKKSISPVGASAGIRAAAAFPGYRVDGGQEVKLRDLGVPSEEFSGRLFRASFNVIMPSDFYSADYGKAQLELAGGYSPGLTSDAKIMVSVNGRNVVSLRLPKQNGDLFEHNAVPLPLGAMHPGLNRVEVEAQAPMESDLACDPIAAISGAKRFLMLDTTKLILPKFARIARMPDLAVTMTGGFPFVGAQQPRLVLPVPDRDVIGAATTIAVQLAIAGGKPIGFRLVNSLEGSGAGPALVIGGAAHIDAHVLHAVGVDAERVAKAWSAQYNAPASSLKREALTRQEEAARRNLMLQRNFPAACHIQKPLGGFERQAVNRRRIDYTATASIVGAANTSAANSGGRHANDPSPPIDRTPIGALTVNEPTSGMLYDEWNNKVRKPNALIGFFKSAYEGAGSWLSARWTDTSALVGAALSNANAQLELTPQSSLLIAQGILGSSADDVLTVIAAPNSAALAMAAPCLVDPRVWSQASGAFSLLDASEGGIKSRSAAATRLIVTAPLTIANLRLIAAGWLSLNPLAYVATAFALALALAFATLIFVRNVGRRQT